MLDEEKMNASYLDGSISLNSDEKSEQLNEVLRVIGDNPSIKILEIGPGSGATLKGLAAAHRAIGNTALGNASITTLELFDSKSLSLSESICNVEQLGARVSKCIGDTSTIPLADESFDIVNCSAVLHEVFSYGDGLESVKKSISDMIRVTKPGGSILYRDVYPIDINLMLPVSQTLERQSWKHFTNIFLPYFLDGEVHLYKNSNIPTNTEGADTTRSQLEVPAGLARELQRHYITLRDHLVRKGSLGINVDTERYNDTEWVRTDLGFEKKIYLDTNSMSESNLEYSEDRTGIFMPASRFEDIVDDKISEFIYDCTRGEYPDKNMTLSEWLSREGRESYIYSTASGVVDMFIESNELCVSAAEDYRVIGRDFYTQYLNRVLGQSAFSDGKLMIRFTKL